MSIPAIPNTTLPNRIQNNPAPPPPPNEVPGQTGEQGPRSAPTDGIDFSSELSNGSDDGGESPILQSLPLSYSESTEPQQPSVPGQDSQSYLAEEKDPEATVAIFDNFKPKPDGSPSHGALTEGVVQEVGGYGEEDTQRYEVGEGYPAGQFVQAVENGDPNALGNMVDGMATEMLDSTTGAMEEVLQDENSQISTISQSQSVSPASVTEQLLARTMPPEQNPDKPLTEEKLAELTEGAGEFRSTLAKSLGLPDDVSDDDLAQAVATEVNNRFENSDSIKDSKERYDDVSQQVADAGISHVLSSGNRGAIRDYLDEHGVQTGEDFYESSLVNDNATVVGATDSKGTETLADDTGFEGNSPDAGAEISAPGTDREMTTQDGQTHTGSGTSFAAPEVAAVMANIQAQHPELSPQEIEDLLVQTAAPVDAPATDVGAGAVRAEEAMAAA